MFNLIKRHKLTVLLLIVVLAFFLRFRNLSAQGLNEDEVNKADAAEAYLHGDFSENREHPMLLKLFVTDSLLGTRFWNDNLGACCQIPPETAVRLPNVIFGALTAIAIFGLAQLFFGTGVGLMAAFVWSISPLAIAINRIAKEDTLLVFFTWLGYYLYVRAKHSWSDSRQRELLALSGASFGFMLASKYFVHYFGLIVLYYWLMGRRGQHYGKLGLRGYALVLGSLIVTFLLFNPVILLPSTWKYMIYYAAEETMTHHGYLMMGRLYYNDPAHILQGMPMYSYALFLALKTQLPLFVVLMVGLVEVIRLRRHPGHFFLLIMFTLWMVPFSLVMVKWFRYMLSLMPIVSILAALGIVRIFKLLSRMSRGIPREVQPVFTACLAAIFFAAPLLTTVSAGPFYSLYLSPLGFGRVGYYFPHDEFDDLGLREAIRQVSAHAPRGSFVGGEAPPVFRYYLRRFDRQDLYNFPLSKGIAGLGEQTNAQPAFVRTATQNSAVKAKPVYVIIQEGRKYFDNISSIDAIESQRKLVGAVIVRGASAATIYRLGSWQVQLEPHYPYQKPAGPVSNSLLTKLSWP